MGRQSWSIKKSANSGLKSFQYFGAHAWNILLTDLKNFLFMILKFNKTVAWADVQYCTVCTLII